MKKNENNRLGIIVVMVVLAGLVLLFLDSQSAIGLATRTAISGGQQASLTPSLLESPVEYVDCATIFAPACGGTCRATADVRWGTQAMDGKCVLNRTTSAGCICEPIIEPLKCDCHGKEEAHENGSCLYSGYNQCSNSRRGDNCLCVQINSKASSTCPYTASGKCR